MDTGNNEHLNDEIRYGCKQCIADLSEHHNTITRIDDSVDNVPASDTNSNDNDASTLSPPPPLSQSSISNPKDFLLASSAELSREFRGKHGKAYLFSDVVNAITSNTTERRYTTGKHIVSDVSCQRCESVIGWKYDKAFENSEKYKEGKYVLEMQLLSVITEG
jgi:hypothetical protein